MVKTYCMVAIRPEVYKRFRNLEEAFKKYNPEFEEIPFSNNKLLHEIVKYIEDNIMLSNFLSFKNSIASELFSGRIRSAISSK